MPAETKVRAPRTKKVSEAVAAAKPAARRPRAKKVAPPPPAPTPERIAFPSVARRFSEGFMDFARKLEAARDSVLSSGSIAAVLAALQKRSHPAHGAFAFHRRGGQRARRTWKRCRASGRA